MSVLSNSRALDGGVEQFYIDGAWWDPSGDERCLHRQQVSGEPDFQIASSGDSDVDDAVMAARRAFDEGPWVRMSAKARRRLVQPLADMICPDADILHHLQVLDN